MRVLDDMEYTDLKIEPPDVSRLRHHTMQRQFALPESPDPTLQWVHKLLTAQAAYRINKSCHWRFVGDKSITDTQQSHN
jgi:hypothetical protein